MDGPLDDRDWDNVPDERASVLCPYCDRVMSVREKQEQGCCDDCYRGDQ